MVREKTMTQKTSRTRTAPRGAAAWLLAALALALGSFVVLAAVSPPNLDETLAAQQQLTLERPYDASVHNDHGNLLVLAGRYDEATAAYRRAIELNPASTLARFNLGILLQQIDLAKQAQAEFEGILEIEPEHARTHYQLGMLFQSRKQRAKAVEHYARAFAYDPELTFANVNPHIIDNTLATEAILASRRYAESPSSTVPRLYGEPDRIADLMLGPLTDEEVAPEAGGPDDDEDGGRVAEEDDEDDHASGTGRVLSVEEEEDADDEDGGSRRVLTREDLESGSSVGQAQSAGRQPVRRSPSAGRTTDRSGSGRSGGVAPVVPLTRSTQGRDTGDDGRSSTDGRSQIRRAPRYIPGRQLSTGRLQLELLPAGPAERESVTATR